MPAALPGGLHRAGAIPDPTPLRARTGQSGPARGAQRPPREPRRASASAAVPRTRAVAGGDERARRRGEIEAAVARARARRARARETDTEGRR
ncbi:MAG: hypothetical protein U5K43_00070 [Halofilum sp. (in: g-proteobacteria)]|nr:hypothetical protein [Halofilum sp. (in: g-proteobacteria)]